MPERDARIARREERAYWQAMRNAPRRDAPPAGHCFSRKRLQRSALAICRTRRSIEDLETGAEGQSRTADTRIFSAVLYQLSYLGTLGECGAGAGTCGLAAGARGRGRLHGASDRAAKDP